MKKTILAVAMLLSGVGMQAMNLGGAGKPAQTISLGSSTPINIAGNESKSIYVGPARANAPVQQPVKSIDLRSSATPVTLSGSGAQYVR